MRLSKCPSALNFFINHSDIYPNLAKDGQPDWLDASELLEKPDSYFFIADGGALFFWRVEDRVYEGDIYFLKRGGYSKARSQTGNQLHV